MYFNNNTMPDVRGAIVSAIADIFGLQQVEHTLTMYLISNRTKILQQLRNDIIGIQLRKIMQARK